METMNRAERRRIKKIGKEIDAPKSYTINQFQLEQMKREITEDVCANSVKILFSIPLAVAKNKYDWTDDQCRMLAEDMCEEYDNYINGTSMSIEEYVELVERVSGIRFESER